MDNHAEKCPCCQAGVHLFECPVFHKLCYITCEIIQRFQSSCLYEYIRKLMAFQCTEHEQLHEGRVFLMCLEEKEGYRHKSLSPILALQPFYQERLPFPVIALHINYCRIKMFLFGKMLEYSCFANLGPFCYFPCGSAFKTPHGKEPHCDLYNLSPSFFCCKSFLVHCFRHPFTLLRQTHLRERT